MVTRTIHFNFTGNAGTLEAAARRARATMEQFRAKNQQAAAQSEAANARAARAWEKVKRSIDTTYASQLKYEEAVRKIRSAAAAANISIDEQNRLIALAGKRYGITAQQIDLHTQQVRASRFATGNLFAQFQDIGVMMASGQSPFLLAVQQGSQINQVFATMSSRAEVLATMKASLRALINPWQLLTIGIIAAGAALVQYLTRSREVVAQAPSLTQALDDIRQGTVDLELEITRLANGLDNLQQAALMVHLEEARNELQQLEGALRAIESSQGVVDQNRLQTVQRALAAQREVVAQLEQELAANQAAVAERDRLRAIEEERNRLALEALEAFREMPSPLQAAAMAAGDINSALRSAVVNARDVVSSFAQAAMMRYAFGEFDDRTSGFRGGRGSVPGFNRGPATPTEIQRQLFEQTQTDEGGGGGGGGGGRQQDPIMANLERLRQSLATEAQLQLEAYQEQQAILDEALERRLLTQKEYQALMEQAQTEHQRRMSDIDVYRYGTGLDQAEAFFGDMADAFAQGNEEMLRISRVFGAAESLINAWRTFSQVMSDPKLPWFAKLPAAISLFGQAIRAVSAIQSVGKGGTGQKAVSAGGAASIAPEPAAAASRPAVSLTLIGDGGFSRAQIVQIAEALNETGADGNRLIDIRGRR